MAKPFNLSEYAYAHRGLWTPNGLTENSLQACLTAAKTGLGIEFDVRPSADGIPMVFHDAILDRITGVSGLFETYDANELEAIPLKASGNIFSLETLLDAWPGDTPLLCEMKIDGITEPAKFAETVGAMLDAYSGPAAAMSFSFRAVNALPQTLMSGQLIDAKKRVGEDTFKTVLGRITKEHCDYIACHTSDAERCKKRGDEIELPVIVWTVKDVETSHSLKSVVDAQIFEGFDPSLVKPH